MIRIGVVVEGAMEESFIKNVLAPTLGEKQIILTAMLLGKPGHKGGSCSFARVKLDVGTFLKQDRSSYCSTMLDLFRLPFDFPGMPLTEGLLAFEKVRRLETELHQEICRQFSQVRADLRFLPYIQLHEFEALLFSDPGALARGQNKPNLLTRLQAIRNKFPTPEDINEGPETAPSKRILKLNPSYKKVLEGTIVSHLIGIDVMRRECPHFNDWVTKLEQLAPL